MGPARGSEIQHQQQNSILVQELGLASWTCAMNMFLYLVAKELHLKKSPSDKLSGPGCAVLWSKYSLASTE